tara:strand:- start:310 stop:1230 length:921 start_codon:yes stop_codon:yes gene_type:complete
VSDELAHYGERDKGTETALVTVAALALSLLFIFQSGILEEGQTVEQVVGSSVVSEEALLAFRASCVILVVVTLAGLVLDPKGAVDHPLYMEERRVMPRTAIGFVRLAAFTQWHFALIGLSFAVSAAASWTHLSGGEVPDWMLVASPALFATSYSCAILVTCVISFHIIGNELSKGHDIVHLFSWYELVMHNANVAILGLALLINGMEVDWRYLAFPIVFGVIYVAWAAIFANFIGGVFIYDFIDYRRTRAPAIYVALLLLLAIFFFIVWTLDRAIESNWFLGGLSVAATTWTMATIRNPAGSEGPE